MDLVPYLLTLVNSLVVGLEFGILTGLIVSIVFLLYYAARPGVRVSKCEVRQSYLPCTIHDHDYYDPTHFKYERIVRVPN